MGLVKKIFMLTNQLRYDEKFGLKNQMVRSAISIPSNIAEGSAKNSPLEFKRYLEMAMGSAFELETQLLILADLKLAHEKDIPPVLTELREIQKMLNQFITKLKANG